MAGSGLPTGIFGCHDQLEILFDCRLAKGLVDSLTPSPGRDGKPVLRVNGLHKLDDARAERRSVLRHVGTK